jgi:hypothetical protein
MTSIAPVVVSTAKIVSKCIESFPKRRSGIMENHYVLEIHADYDPSLVWISLNTLKFFVGAPHQLNKIVELRIF